MALAILDSFQKSIHEEVRSAGIVPGTAAIMSLLVPEPYKNYWKIPVLEEEDIYRYREIILLAAKQLAAGKEPK